MWVVYTSRSAPARVGTIGANCFGIVMDQRASILQTKLYCPRQASGVVHRERLLALLDGAFQFPLTLVSAPPGYGKSVLAADWTRARDATIAWLILDQEESSLPRFMAYFVAAMQHARPGSFQASAGLLATSELPSISEIARQFANEICALGEDLVLVLDDYHVVDHGSPVHDLLALLLDHPPQNLHIVMLTRRDPPLQLARLRANNLVLEFRLDDLRFRRDETGELLGVALGRAVSADVIASFQEVLEGWGAGIRMASLAALRSGDEDALLRKLPRGLQQIQEYLFDEVIEGLDRPTHRYLLLSALTPRFCAPLLERIEAGVDETQPGDGSKTFVEFVDRNNMFTIPLDADGKWFRYHHLFRELLLARLGKVAGADEVKNALAAASRWFEENEFIEDALRVLLDQEEVEAAAAIIVRQREAALDRDMLLDLDGWLSMFPLSETHRWPALLLGKASLAMFNFDLDLVVDLVHQLDALASSGRLTPAQSGELEFFRALPLFWAGEITAAREALERAAALPMSCDQITGELHVYLGISRCMSGDGKLAIRELERAEKSNDGRRNILATRLAASKSYVHYFSLRPEAALREAERLVAIASSDVDSKHAWGWGHYVRAMSLFQTARFEAASQAVHAGLPNGDHVEKNVLVDFHLIKGICALHLGDERAAGQAISDLRGLADIAAVGTGVRELALSSTARLYLLGGDLERALELAAELPQSPAAGTLTMWLEEPSVTWAKLQLARKRRSAAQAALSLIVALRRQAEAQHLLCQQVELLLLEAVARSGLDECEAAHALFQQAAALAGPAGWSAPLIEIARWNSALRSFELPIREQQAFVRLALNAGRNETLQHDEGVERSKANGAGSIPLESFTNRELDILELLAERCRNKEIAGKLFISTNTVSYHLKHVYKKLEVSGRREAVVRATELGILQPR